MIADILMALVVSLVFQLFGAIGKTMKYIMMLTGCVTLIVVYFVRGLTFSFIGSMDLAVWILFVAAFNIIFSLLEQYFVRICKEMKKNGVCIDEVMD